MKNNEHPYALIIYGPTGVGKTDIALMLGSHIPIEIINMDVGQFYTPLSIGTAKPHWRESTIAHHLFDIISTPENITVVEYRHMAQQKVAEITARGNIPVFVGGSGFYLRSLLFPLKEIQKDSTNNHITLGLPSQDLWQELYKIDPQRALSIDKNDTYRLQRALDMWYNNGKKPTDVISTYEPFCNYVLFSVQRNTRELNERILSRSREMLTNGWVEEAQELCDTPWYAFLKNKKIIGYNEIFQYIKHTSNIHKKHEKLEELAEIITIKTRQYAKRQRTFWRKLQRELEAALLLPCSYTGTVQSTNLTNNDIHLYINELLCQLTMIGKKNE